MGVKMFAGEYGIGFTINGCDVSITTYLHYYNKIAEFLQETKAWGVLSKLLDIQKETVIGENGEPHGRVKLAFIDGSEEGETKYIPNHFDIKRSFLESSTYSFLATYKEYTTKEDDVLPDDAKALLFQSLKGTLGEILNLQDPADDIEELKKILSKTDNPFSTDKPNNGLPALKRFSGHLAMFNSPEMVDFASMQTYKTLPELNLRTGVATQKRGQLTLDFDNFTANTKLNISTHKLFHTCIMALTQINHYRGDNRTLNHEVSLPLKEYAELVGVDPNNKPALKQLRRQTHADLETLFKARLSVTVTETEAKRKPKALRDFDDMRLCYRKSISGGVIRFSFSPDLAEHLTSAYLIPFNPSFLKLSGNNPNAFPLSLKLWAHSNMDNNIKRKTADILSVKNVLKHCPNMLTYDEVMQGSKKIKQLIIDPLEKTLDAVPDLEWEYCNAKKEVLTDKQLLKNSSEILNLYINFRFKNAPDHTKRLEHKAEQAKEKAGKQKRQSKPKP